MPQKSDQRNAHPKVLGGLFWGGVGLAPLAVLIMLVASGGVLKVAAVIAMMSVVLIGVSITLRRDPETVRVELHDTILDEVDQLRHDVREDVNAAARNTHRALTDRIQAMHGGIEALRAHVDELRAQIDDLQARAITPMVAPPPVASGAARVGAPAPQQGVVHTETVQVTRRTMLVDAGDDATRGTVYGSS